MAAEAAIREVFVISMKSLLGLAVEGTMDWPTDCRQPTPQFAPTGREVTQNSGRNLKPLFGLPRIGRGAGEPAVRHRPDFCQFSAILRGGRGPSSRGQKYGMFDPSHRGRGLA